jgi:hypothetical protein
LQVDDDLTSATGGWGDVVQAACDGSGRTAGWLCPGARGLTAGTVLRLLPEPAHWHALPAHRGSRPWHRQQSPGDHQQLQRPILPIVQQEHLQFSRYQRFRFDHPFELAENNVGLQRHRSIQQQQHLYLRRVPPFAPPQHFSSSSSSQQAYASYQTLQALANVIDTGAGDRRYIVNVFVAGGFVPGTNLPNTPSQVNAKWQSEWFGGIEGNGIWHWPGSTYSIVSRTGFQLSQLEVRSRTIVQLSQSVLLSNDAWGIAAGPAVSANILTSQAGGAGSNPDSILVGAEIRAQPYGRCRSHSSAT